MRLCHRPLLIGSFLCALLGFACAPELERLERTRAPRGTIGEEVYKSVCRRVAGTELPQDVSGRRSEAVCMGDPERVQQALASATSRPADPAAALPLRLMALAQRRAAIVQAVDQMLPDELADELEQLFRKLLPFYEPPEERIQQATRSLAAVLERLSNPGAPAVQAGLARVSHRGMLPRDGSVGLLRGTLGAAGLRDMARSFLPLVSDDPLLRPHFETLLSGLALELSTIDLDAAPDSDLQRLKRLLLRTHPDFGSGKPLFGAVRDGRGLPTPTRSGSDVPFPFVDADADGVADAQGSQLLMRPELARPLPEPFAVFGESAVARDAYGRALGLSPTGESDGTRTLYETQDADVTLLAGALRAAQKLFRDDSVLQQMSLIGPAILGDHVPTRQRYGALDFAYPAPDPVGSPLLDLVYGSTALLDQASLADSLALTSTVLDLHEGTLVEALGPLLMLEHLTRVDGDAYPEASLAAGHTFWDELLFELEKISRRRGASAGAGSDTLLEALMRGSLGFARNLQKPGAPIEQLVDPELLRHQGVVIASLMRFKDEWRANPTGESKRPPGEPVVLGGFRTPVDRDRPDSPATCGRDGCGGLIEGTPFERWRKPNQNCMIQRIRRPISGKDCGEAPNQSILQRSLGLIAEMAGRSQCNKPISISDLLEYAVLKEPCVGDIIPDSPACVVLRRQQEADRKTSVISAEDAVRKDYSCPDVPGAPCRAYADKYPAAFVDPDGAGGVPASIQACHMLDLPDVGRTFGAAVTHEFRLELPNPWVRRYLEDIARAGDHDGDGAADIAACTDFQIVDPTVTPPCIPEAASLSRDIYEDMPISVDTLGELMEFLLDDTGLFTNDADTRDLRPDVKALSRVLFAPAGSTSFVIFDPLLLSGAPPACAAAPSVPVCSIDDSEATPAGGCCIEDLTRPPLRYRLDTYYGSTTFAWEQPIALRDGRTISFLDTMNTLSDAVARFDFDARRGDDATQFEDTSYVFSTIGKLIAQHYDSADNPAVQSLDPRGLNYRRKTGLMRYERLAADALDDGSIDHGQRGGDGLPLYDTSRLGPTTSQLGVLYHGLPLIRLLDELSIDGGPDGIDLSAELTEQLLSPHARCAGVTGDRRVLHGVGACDRHARGEPGLAAPLTYRDGRSFVCWEDKTCFDGMQRARRFPSVLYLLLDAIGTVDDRLAGTPELDAAFKTLTATLIDTYFKTSNGRFEDRQVRGLLSSLLDYTRERITEERGAGTLATLPARSNQDAADLLHNPIVAGMLGLSVNLSKHPEAITALRRYTASSLSEQGGQDNLRPLLAGLFDLVQLMPGDSETNAALQALASAFSSQVEAAVRGAQVTLAPQDSAIGRNLSMLRETARLDTASSSVLERMLGNAARLPQSGASPLETILDVAVEINRVRPGEPATPSAEDLRVALQRIAQVMRDDKRGFERLYKIVRCTTGGSGQVGCE